MIECYNKKWEPITQVERSELMNDQDYKRIARTDDMEWTIVSTVWLWLDHRLGWEEGDNPPIIFETMVFSDHKAIDWEQVRYCTLEEAKAWHKKMCEYAKKVLAADSE